MIKQLAEELQPLLTQSRVGLGMFSDTYDEATILNWKSGIQPTYSIGKRDPYQRRPFLQIIVRSTQFDKCVKEAQIVSQFMDRAHGVYGKEILISAIQTGEPLNRGRDTKNRWEFLMNFTLRVQTLEEE